MQRPAPKPLQDLQRKHPEIVDEVWRDDDGLWLCLKRAFWCAGMDCRTLHEHNVKDMLAMFKTVRPARPDEMEA